MKNVVKVLRAAERALREGDRNCGGGPDNVYHEPLRQVRAEIRRLVAMGPSWSTCVQWTAGDVNGIPVTHLKRAAEELRGL